MIWGIASNEKKLSRGERDRAGLRFECFSSCEG
jgi:hypothetical protein